MFSDDFDTSEKARVPAWTDRILWKRRKPQGIISTHFTEPTYNHFTTGIPLDSWKEPSLVFYGRAELKQSDHRPVVGIVDVQVTMMIMIIMVIIMIIVIIIIILIMVIMMIMIITVIKMIMIITVTRPGVDKVKPKVWFKYSLSL